MSISRCFMVGRRWTRWIIWNNIPDKQNQQSCIDKAEMYVRIKDLHLRFEILASHAAHIAVVIAGIAGYILAEPVRWGK